MRVAEALQEALAAEHAAVYVYGVVGAKVRADDAPSAARLNVRLRAAYTMHRARRDHLRSQIADTGADPVAASVAYDVPTEPPTLPHLRQVALGAEERCSAVYAQLVTSSIGETRRWAVGALVDSAVRRLDLGDQADAYPGLDELRSASS